MSERDKLIQDYAQKKITHDQQEEVLRKSTSTLTQSASKSGIRRKKSSKLITNSSPCSLSGRSSVKSSKKSPQKNVLHL